MRVAERHPYRVRSYYVYIVASQTRRLYIGVTNNLVRRVHEHKHHFADGFTSRYNIHRLVYFEIAGAPYDAICREKQLKGLLRRKKVGLIELANPEWRDLYDEILR